MLVERQRIERIYTYHGRMTRVETVKGSGMNILTSDVPPAAYRNPTAFYLEATWQNADKRGYPSLRIVSAEKTDKTDERKSQALMQIIERLITRHHQGLIVLDEPSFELFELAKRISWAENKTDLSTALTDFRDFEK